MSEHVCTVEDCGWTCWMDDGLYVRDLSVSFGDAGSVDGEAVCGCEGHD